MNCPKMGLNFKITKITWNYTCPKIAIKSMSEKIPQNLEYD